MTARQGLGLIALLLVCAVRPAVAQVGGLDKGNQLLEEKRQQEMRERAQKGKSGLDITVAPPKPGAADDVCVGVKSIIVEGSKLVPKVEIDGIVKAHHKPCMGQKAIEGLIIALSKAYIDRGFITTRTYPLAQDLTETGVLKLRVVDGMIEKFTYLERPASEAATDKPAPPATADGKVSKEAAEKAAKVEAEAAKERDRNKPPAHPGPQRKIETAFPTTAGEILYLRALEQGLDQINRLPSNKATMDIKPGEKPGGSEIVVTNEMKEPWRVNAKYVYTGYRTPFEKRGDVTLEADDLFSANDTWYLAYSGTNVANSLSFLGSVPYGYRLFSAQGSYSESMTQLTSTSDMFTRTASATLSASELLFRDAKQKLKIEASAALKWNSRMINAVELAPQMFPVLRGGVAYERYITGAFLSGSLGLNAGLGPLEGEDSDADGSPQARFLKLDASGVYYRSYGPGITSYTVATLQYSPQVLYNSEQIIIGGQNSLRGYTSSQQPGDWGGYVQNTVSFPLHTIVGGRDKIDAAFGPALAAYVAPLTPYVFVDAGVVRDTANAVNRSAVGVGAGLTYAKDRVTTDFYVGFPVLHSSAFTEWFPELRMSVNVKLY